MGARLAIVVLLVTGLGACASAVEGPLAGLPTHSVAYVDTPWTVQRHATGDPLTWDFGDGTRRRMRGRTFTHTYGDPGHYVAVAETDAGARHAVAVTAVHRPLQPRPRRAAPLAFTPDGDQLWSVNQDHGSVTVVDTATWNVAFTAAVGASPRTLSMHPDGHHVAVAVEEADRIVVLDAADGTVVQTLELGYGAAPFGVAYAPDGRTLYVTAQGPGTVLGFDAGTYAAVATAVVDDHGGQPRGLAVHPDGTVWATRFRSVGHRALVWRLDGGLTEAEALVLAPYLIGDSDTESRGIPGYLAAAALSPDGAALWLPSLQANLFRGGYRDGQPLTFESTARAVVSIVDAANVTDATWPRRFIDDRDRAVDVAFTPLGDYAYLPIQGSGTVEVFDVARRSRIGTVVGAGAAPQGVAVSPDGRHLAVQSWLTREILVWSLTGDPVPTTTIARIAATTTEPLAPDVLRGKRLFHHAADVRMSKSGYLSCASCHADGGDDGLVWDFTDRGEGLRNTIALAGKAATAHGPLHWSANFDELQDFEHDIRDAFGGRGFLTDTVFHRNGHDEPLGTPKAGLSEALDALAAYVASLDTFRRTPWRSTNGALSEAAERGRTLFDSAATGCRDCHSGPRYTDSSLAVTAGAFVLHDVGTIGPASGGRLGGPLTGLDTPTLRDLHATAPYLHDGSAAELRDVLVARNSNDRHGKTSHLSQTQIDDLVAFLRSLDGTP